jgi:hypothetical protein
MFTEKLREPIPDILFYNLSLIKSGSVNRLSVTAGSKSHLNPSTTIASKD